MLDADNQTALADLVRGFFSSDGQLIRIVDNHLTRWKGELLKLSDPVTADSDDEPLDGADEGSGSPVLDHENQTSGSSPSALFRRAINFGSADHSPVPVVDNDDNGDVEEFQAETHPRSSNPLNDTDILNFQIDPDVFVRVGQSFTADLLSIINSGLQQHLSGLSLNLSENQIMQDKIKLWIKDVYGQLETFFIAKQQRGGQGVTARRRCAARAGAGWLGLRWR